MPPALLDRIHFRQFGRQTIGYGLLIGVFHLTALALMVQSEIWPLDKLFFLLTWAVLNSVFLFMLRRPGVAAALSLAVILAIIGLSEFKISILSMSITFFDLLVIDPDSVSFLLSVFPDWRTTIALTALLVVPALALIWWFDPFRIPRSMAALGLVASLAGIVGLGLSVPDEPWRIWRKTSHVSSFARSGVSTMSLLIRDGWLEADAATDRPLEATSGACRPQRKPPHVILVLDESSFDITAIPGVNVPDGYSQYFRSFDGRSRLLLVEALGGPTWYTEYNVLTGLSVRSYQQRMAYNVTRIAAGHVTRGLPHALRDCGYKTYSLYPAYGAFLNARQFQQGTGVQRFIDLNEMRAQGTEPDSYFFDRARDILKNEQEGKPLFITVYMVVNHFPWTSRFHPELTPEWQQLNKDLEVDEYVRRQGLTAKDFAAFTQHLREDFPNESFLIVRFGDHQPALAKPLIDATSDPDTILGRLWSYDPVYFTTYYAINAINFEPAEMSSAMKMLDAPYLPLVVLEAAGLPLDPSFAEQKRILQRCNGLFYRCADGAEARRFNRLLIDAGLIKGL